MTLPTAGEDDPRLPTDDDVAAAAADSAGPKPADPELAVDREGRRLQDGPDGGGPAGAAEAERTAQRPDF